MGITEIVLLLAGGIVFILSFVIPAKKEADHGETRGLAKEEIRNLVSEELESVRGHVDDVVEEAVTYSIEKTERSLERLSNEKIMAVSEYSDTVLSEIHKNHEEVMFLYDMLNDKHINLKNTVSEVNKTVKEAEETKREAEEVVNTFQRLAPEAMAAASVENRGMNSRSSQPAQPIRPRIPAFAQPVEAAQSIQPVDLQHFVQSVQSTQTQSAVQTAPKPLEITPAVPVELIQPQISAFVRPVEPQQFALPVESEQPVEPQQLLPPVQSEQPVEPQHFVPQTEPEQPVEPQHFVPQTEPEQPVKLQQFVSPVEPEQPVKLQQFVSLVEPEQPVKLQRFVPPVQPERPIEPQHFVSQIEPEQPAELQQFVSLLQSEQPVELQQFEPLVQAPEAMQALPNGAISFTQETDGQGRNYNDVILDLYKKGKSKVAIAKELNLGVGEVNLVIDLYKNL